MANNQIVRQDFEEYVPKFNEDTGEYYDVCPYEKFSRCQKITYRCPCISGRSLNTRQQFLQHFDTKTHTTWRNNLGKDENKQIIKNLQIDNAKKDIIIQQKINQNNDLEKENAKLSKKIIYNQNSLNLQARQLKKFIEQQRNLRKEISTYASNLKIKNDLIIELEENIKLLEEASNLSVDYDTISDSEKTEKVMRNYSIDSECESETSNFTVSESLNNITDSDTNTDSDSDSDSDSD